MAIPARNRRLLACPFETLFHRLKFSSNAVAHARFATLPAGGLSQQARPAHGHMPRFTAKWGDVR